MSKFRQIFYSGRLSPAKIFLFINLIFIAGVFILGFRQNAFEKGLSTSDISFYNGQSLIFIGRVCEEADTDYKSRRLTICALGKNTGLVLITTDLYPIYNYGDFIQISGTLKAPPEIDGFDYEKYLARYDIYSVMYYPQINSVRGTLSGQQNIYLALMRFKGKLKDTIDLNLPEPEAGLANALLLGYRRTVMREDLQIFSRVGLSHMIAISGSHITILSAMIINFLLALGLRRQRALLIIFIFLVLYPLVTGLAASAVRSAIMGGLAFLAMYYQRSGSLIKALVFSAAAMLIFNPKIMRADIGFQLSFMALLGIIYLYPLGDEAIRRLLAKTKFKTKTKNRFKIILDTINLTLVSQIIILPIALISFKQLSIIAPLSNVLVLWTFPPLLAALIAALFLTALIPAGGLLWFYPSYLLLKYIFISARVLAEPAWAAININSFNWTLGIIYYSGLFILVRIIKRISRN